ncbi:MAG TPA: O-antigen ligase family protein [Patescibacteria group bacterium]|nr:O-antigen ligase family protein [Patescibacteria group bacterium]
MKYIKFLFIFALILFPFGELLRFQINHYVAIKPIDLVVGVTVVWWLIYQIVKIKDQKYKLTFNNVINNKFALPFILFVSIGLISLLINLAWLKMDQFLVSLFYLIRFVSYALLLPIVLQFDQKFKKIITVFLFIDGIVILVIGYLQYIFYNSLQGLFHLGWDEHMHRMFSTFLDPNFAGGFLVLYLLFVSGFVMKQKTGSRKQILFIILLLVTLLAMFLTFSRSSFLMLLAGSAAFFIIIQRKKLLVVLLSFVALFIFSVSPQFYDENMNLFRVASSMSRLENYQFAFRVIEDHPVIGVGFNSYRYVKDMYGMPRDWVDAPSHADAGVDNSFLFVLATTGIIGLICYLWFWIRILRKLLIEYKKKKKIFVAVAFASIIGLCIHALFINSLFFAPLMLWLFVLIGLEDTELH